MRWYGISVVVGYVPAATFFLRVSINVICLFVWRGLYIETVHEGNCSGPEQVCFYFSTINELGLDSLILRSRNLVVPSKVKPFVAPVEEWHEKKRK